MRPEKLSEAIGMLPDEIIEETDAVRTMDQVEHLLSAE